MRVGPATLVFLKHRGDAEAARVLALGSKVFSAAHEIGMSVGFYYSEGKLEMLMHLKHPHYGANGIPWFPHHLTG